jgi:uncharacterized membrane protein YbaN (DUF454 family)
MSRRATAHHPESHRPPRTPLHKRRLRNFLLGIGFFVLGVIGLFIPVMPQIIFFFLSLVFFSMVSQRLRRAMRRFRRRHPSIDKAYTKWRERSRRKRLKLIRKARKFRHDAFDGGR